MLPNDASNSDEKFQRYRRLFVKQDLTGFHFGYVSAVLIRHLRIYLYMLLIDEFRMYCK